MFPRFFWIAFLIPYFIKYADVPSATYIKARSMQVPMWNKRLIGMRNAAVVKIMLISSSLRKLELMMPRAIYISGKIIYMPLKIFLPPCIKYTKAAMQAQGSTITDILLNSFMIFSLSQNFLFLKCIAKILHCDGYSVNKR